MSTETAEKSHSKFTSNTKRKRLGELIINGQPHKAWIEDGKISFREKGKRRTSSVGIADVFDQAQLGSATEVSIEGRQFFFWLKRGVVTFCSKDDGGTRSISLHDVFMHAEGQLSLPLGGVA